MYIHSNNETDKTINVSKIANTSTLDDNSEWQWGKLGHMQVCTSLQTGNHTSRHHSVFTARCYISTVYAMALCPCLFLSVCHKSLFYKKQLNILSRKQNHMIAQGV